MNRYSWRPAVLAALCGGALASPVLGDELLGMQSDQNTYLSGVVRGNFPDLNHNTAVGINTAPWRIDTALPIGADLFLFGGNGSDQQFWVIGRTPQDPTQQNYEGNYQVHFMAQPGTVEAGNGGPIYAAALGYSSHAASQSALLLLQGHPEVAVYDSLPKRSNKTTFFLQRVRTDTLMISGAPYTPFLLAAAGARQYFVSDHSNRVLRVSVAAGDTTTLTECDIAVSGKPAPQVTALSGPGPGFQGGDGESTGVMVALDNGSVVTLDVNCSGTTTVPPPATPAAPYTALAATGNGNLPFLLFGSSVGAASKSGLLQVWKSATMQFNDQMPVLSAPLLTPPVALGQPNGAPAGAVAALSTTMPQGAQVMVGGTKAPAHPGLQLYQYDANAGTVSAGTAVDPALASLATPAVAASAAPGLGFNARSVDLAQAFLVNKQRADFVQVFAPFNQYYPVNTDCQRTTFFAATDFGADGIGVGGTFTTSYNSKGSMAPLRDLIGIGQAGQGEDCVVNIGGALIRVDGLQLAQRAMALVLDRSGSMASPIPSQDAPDRYTAMRTAALSFASVVSQLPDAKTSLFGVLPFDDQYGAPSATITGDKLHDALLNLFDVQKVLSPRGSTDIRGALETAADWLGTVQCTDSMGGKVPCPAHTVLLMTDGMHNTYHEQFDPPDHLEPVLPGSGNESAVLLGKGLTRLYAIGLSDNSFQDALTRLVDRVNPQTGRPGGLLTYATSAASLAQFFTKVLLDYVGATSLIDPIVTVDSAHPYMASMDLGRDVQDVIVSVAWGNPATKLSVKLFNDATNMELNEATLCRQAATYASCYLDAATVAALPSLRVRVEQASGPAVQAMVEVAGRTGVRVRPDTGHQSKSTAQKLLVRAVLTERGAPLVGATVTATLERPTTGIGTVLANAAISPSQIRQYASSHRDSSSVEAKAALLPAGQLPGRMQQTVTLNDDGKSGDDAPNDGTFGAYIDTPVPGIYTLTVQVSYDSRLSGKGVRGAALSTQVSVGLDGGKSVVQILAAQPPQGTEMGTVTLLLKPQDGRGNLLGPGHAEDLVFRQSGKTLPAKVSEPDTLDGTYVAAIDGVSGDGPVVLVSGGGGAVIVPDPAGLTPMNPTPPGPPPGTCTGCCCDLSRHPGPAGGPVALAAGLLLLLGTRRRRT